MASARTRRDTDFARTTGEHGYDTHLDSMHAIFVAAGPDFKERLVIEPFENIQIYNLMCRILGLKPAANDGDPSWPDTVLRQASRRAAIGFGSALWDRERVNAGFQNVM